MFQTKHPPNKFNEGGRPQNQYRYMVSASPAQDHDVSLNHFHGTLFYNENGSVDESKFKFVLLNSPNWTGAGNRGTQTKIRQILYQRFFQKNN